MLRRFPGWLFLIAVSAATVASADTLVLRNGQRIEGVLVGVRADTIEFEEVGSRSRARSYDRGEVRRIEIDDRGSSSGSNWGGSPSGGSSSSLGGSGSSGMRERTVNVNAAEGWSDTGIELRRDQEVRFSATGKVRWGPNRQDGPAGEGGNHYNANRPMPNRPAAALIGKVGGGSDVFFIGNDQAPIRVRQSGRLYLGVNDDFLQDNSGSFRVIVYY
jgi:hypothetical protein